MTRKPAPPRPDAPPPDGRPAWLDRQLSTRQAFVLLALLGVVLSLTVYALRYA